LNINLFWKPNNTVIIHTFYNIMRSNCSEVIFNELYSNKRRVIRVFCTVFHTFWKKTISEFKDQSPYVSLKIMSFNKILFQNLQFFMDLNFPNHHSYFVCEILKFCSDKLQHISVSNSSVINLITSSFLRSMYLAYREDL